MKVLVAEDEENIRESLCRYLTMKGLPAVPASNGLSAQRMLQQGDISAAVVDLKMPGLDGMGLLQWVKAQRLRVPVIMISAFGEIGDAVTAMKEGAADYLVKPFDSAVLLGRLRDCLAEEDFRAHLELASTAETGLEFVGGTAAAQRIREIVRVAADTPSTVLITGESGTGKEIVARLLHASSSRRDGPFVAVNVGGLPETLLESELFGYEKGAFTGADDRRVGTIERAAGGTLFLDEIGDMPLPLQVKILRFLQDLKVQRLGGTRAIPVDARVVAATNTNLESRVQAGLFREDLFYRLNVVRIDVPPLRERMEDIPLLAASILVRLRKKLGKQVDGIGAHALELLRRHPFLGNVRELENILERACLFMSGTIIDTGALDLGGTRPPIARRSAVEVGQGGTATLETMERLAIAAALQRWDGNRTKAAAELGISRRTLFNKLKAYGIPDSSSRGT
jgi:two-component system, NtrC family, response regulator AtoC